MKIKQILCRHKNAYKERFYKIENGYNVSYTKIYCIDCGKSNIKKSNNK